MQTVQLQCGSCSNVIAVGVEHLGAQVQCPHCRAVVQTPPASAFGIVSPSDGQPAAAPSYTPPSPAQEHVESIFSEPAPSDDLFDNAPAPRIQMPEEPRPVYRAPAPPEPEPDPETALEHEVEEEVPADLSGMRARVRAAQRKSNLAPTLLVFLIPYAICCTAFIGYLLYIWPSIDRLDYLPDPKKEGARKTSAVYLPAHDSPIADHRRVSLKQAIRVGDIEITPLKVVRLPSGLQLEFLARNHAAKVALTPIEPEFFKYDPKAAVGTAKPFTYLERAGQNDRIYGGYVDYLQGNGNARDNGQLQPGQEEVIQLTTETPDLSKVRSLLAGEGRFLWRLQLRRGFITYRGSDISATAVIGVEFSATDIVDEKG